MIKELVDLWPVIVFLGAATIWFVRLESKVLYLERDHANHKENYKESSLKIDLLQASISEIKETLARIEERIK